jgi:NitT/TauT family transport system ATP-binding protein
MGKSGTAVSVDHLSFFYLNNGEKIEALKEISFSLKKGGIYVLIGPSGCGKSTLLYILAGLLSPQTGKVLINNEQPVPGQRSTSLILQDYGLLPWKTVWDNVVLGLVIRRLPAREVRFKGERMLKEMGLWEMQGRYPAELSGGQRQRVAIARALVTEPDLLLMDEPFSSLDALSREGLQDVLLSILRGGGLTALLVTHNIEEAAYLGQQIIVFSPHPGYVHKIFENPGACSPGYRKTAEFFRLCMELRKTLEFGREPNTLEQAG